MKSLPTVVDLKNLSLEDLQTQPMEATEPDLETEFQNYTIECEYTHSPHWWREKLVSKETLPRLWDLDVNEIRAKHGRWDWELLVRQLSQTEIHEPDDRSVSLPPSLRNRRRIWRILDEARINDIAGVNEQRMVASLEEKRERRERAKSGRRFTPHVLGNPPPDFDFVPTWPPKVWPKGAGSE